MADDNVKIGVIACSGEEMLGGTISRLVTRKMMEQLRADNTVTLCLPLFLAGGEEERAFAVAYPTITVDGCEKCCAKRATEKLSGPVSASVVVTELMNQELAHAPVLTEKEISPEIEEAVKAVQRDLVTKFDLIRARAMADGIENDGSFKGCGCGS